MTVTVRRLGPGDEAILQIVAGRFKQREIGADTAAALLGRDEVVVAAALEAGEPVGFALAYLLPRIDRPQAMMFVYELEVAAAHRRRGHGRRLLDLLKRLSGQRRLMKMFVSTAEDNEEAQALYAAAGGERAQRASAWFGWTDWEREP